MMPWRDGEEVTNSHGTRRNDPMRQEGEPAMPCGEGRSGRLPVYAPAHARESNTRLMNSVTLRMISHTYKDSEQASVKECTPASRARAL